MDFILKGEECYLLNRSFIAERTNSQGNDDSKKKREEYSCFNLKDLLCEILNFNLTAWKNALDEYLLKTDSSPTNQKRQITMGGSELFELSATLPFMFKSVQLAFLVEEVCIYAGSLLTTKNICQPNQYFYEENEDYFLNLRNGICDLFIEQNHNYLKHIISCSNIDYLFLRGLAGINEEYYIYPSFSYYSFSQLIIECNKIYKQWSKSTNRSTIDNSQKMAELLSDSPLISYQNDNRIANVTYRTKVLDIISEPDFQVDIYKVNSLGGLFYLMLSQCSKFSPLKKCFTCNSYYRYSKYKMYCSGKCKKDNPCVKKYQKLYNRYYHNQTKYQKEIEILSSKYNSWKNREIDNETFLQCMKELQERF